MEHTYFLKCIFAGTVGTVLTANLSIVTCQSIVLVATRKQTSPKQRRHMFPAQQRCRCHDNGGTNCSSRCPLVGTPSRYETESIREETEVRGRSRRPAAQDADISESS